MDIIDIFKYRVSSQDSSFYFDYYVRYVSDSDRCKQS